MLLGNSALCAHLVNKARNKPDHEVGHVTGLRVLEPALCVEALSHTAGNAVK